MDAWIITDNDQIAARVGRSLRDLSLDCPSTQIIRFESTDSWIKSHAGYEGLLLLASSQFDQSHLELVRELRGAVDGAAKLVVVSSIRDQDMVLAAIRGGASDFLSGGENLHDELANFIQRIRSERKQAPVKGRAISIVPCHAPSDASLVAVNLAAVIAKREGSCGLLDFHVRGGDLALLLKLTPRHTMIDLLNLHGSIDEAMFEQALTTHESGVRLLAAPNSLIDLRNIRPQVCQQIVGMAQRLHQFVIINSEDVQHAEQVRALVGSDDIVLTMRLDIVSLHRAKQHVEFMTRNRIAREQLHVVALGTGHSGELPVATVKKVLEISSLRLLPDDPVSTIRSVNVGSPLVIEAPRAKISRAIVEFAEEIAPPTSAAASTTSRSPISAVKAAAVALNTLTFSR